MTGVARLGFSRATPVAKAAADAACPDGNDVVRGAWASCRAPGTWSRGRSRAARLLPTMLAVALAAASPPRPRQAALRAHRSPLARNPAATAIHSQPWLASRLSLGITTSSSRESVSAMRRRAARSKAAIMFPRLAGLRPPHILRSSNRLLHPAPAGAGPGLDEQPEEAERAFPFLGVHGLHLGVDHLEGPGQRHADAPEDHRKPALGLLAQRGLERRVRRQGLQNWPKLDLFFDALELVHALLQPPRDRQVPGLDDVAGVRLRGGLADEQQVVQRVVDEVEVALDVVPVDGNAARDTKEALEFHEAHHWHPAASLMSCALAHARRLRCPCPLEGEPDRHRALADGRGDPFGRAAADIADSKDAGLAGLQGR